MIRIGILWACDYRGYPPGGSQPTIEIFLKGAQEHAFDIWLFGMTTSKDEPVGKISKRRIYGRDYPFVPLFYLDADRYKDRKPLVPVRAKAFLAYLRKRRFINSLNFDVLYLHSVETLPLVILKRQAILYHFHGPEEEAAEYSRYNLARTKPFRYAYGRAIRSILRNADQFIVIDPETYARYTARVPDRNKRFHLFPTAIDVEQFRPLPNFDRAAARNELGLPADGKMVLFVGRLSWRKGVDLVVKAFSAVASKVPHVFLAIVGIGEDREALQALARDLKVSDRVYFLGKLPHLPSPEMPRLFNCADVSLVASLQESLALVITEALACGTPVISTRVGIAPEVIRNGVTGFLLESREPAEMAGRIREILLEKTYDSAQCVAVAQPYGETSRPICDIIELMCARKDGFIDGSKPVSLTSKAAR
jgi:glycosyltransferase involved in cell wall biosynthesis